MDLSRYNKPVNLSGPSNLLNNMSARATSTSQMVLSHQMGLEAAHYGNELGKDYASHVGGINSALSAQDHGQRLKEASANNRHAIKQTVLNHNNDLEKRAVDHHLSTERLRTESGLKVTEANNASKNTISEAGVAHRHAGELMNRIAASGQGGTAAEFSGNGIKAKLTLKIPSAPATNPTPTVAPRPTKSFVGMPGNRASVASPKGPQPTVTRGANGRMVSAKNPTPTAALVKKAAAKKAAPTKGQPTVTRDKTTGRMIGIKKK